MSPERVAPLPKSKAPAYFRKATNFARGMDAGISDRNFDAAGLTAVHAVIAACDALTVARLGLRSTAQDHFEVLKLLIRCDVPATFLTHVRETLALKNRVEYEARAVTPEEATRLRVHVQRVLGYAEKALGP